MFASFLLLLATLFSCEALVPAPSTSVSVDRRSAVHHAGSFGLVAPFLSLLTSLVPSSVASEPLPVGLAVPKTKSVLVLGANGKTGRECVAAALYAQRPCIATSRSGIFEDDGSMVQNKLLSMASVDVSSLESLERAISSVPDLGAVIFAASASASGNDPFPVDRDGVVHTAKCCIANNIPRLVIVSSGTVTRPDTAVYKLLNFAGKGIMEAKIQGEDRLRELYSDPAVLEKKLGYTVIRPGGLTTGESLGPSALELNQGDSKSGRLSRADVASLCINCLDSADTWDTTFECYESVTAKPLESVGLSNILKSTDPTTFRSGFERQGDSWSDLFAGLKRDEGHII